MQGRGALLMKEQWQELLTVLNKMLTIYQTILLLSQQKKEILLAAKAKELEKVTQQEEILIVQAGKLEELRGKLVISIMASYGIQDGEISLEDLKKIAESAVVKELDVFSLEFSKVMTELAELNKLNAELVKQALGFINYNINVLSQTAVGPTYAPKGQSESTAPQRKIFDARV